MLHVPSVALSLYINVLGNIIFEYYSFQIGPKV